jgi:hypothetical protein
MPTPYRSRVEVKCNLETCEVDPVRADVKRECLSCEHSEANLIDLEERPIGEIKKQTKAKGKKEKE